MILYHGSNVIVQEPKIFGKRFLQRFWIRILLYNFRKAGKTVGFDKTHIVNFYEYLPDKSLDIKTFSKMTEEWLQFVVNCRLALKHDYDVVEDPMADDTIWDYVEDYIAERISKEAFWELVKFKYPTHQIVFCTEKALQTIKFEGSYSL